MCGQMTRMYREVPVYFSASSHPVFSAGRVLCYQGTSVIINEAILVYCYINSVGYIRVHCLTGIGSHTTVSFL